MATFTVMMPEALYHELWDLEIDTYDPEDAGADRTAYYNAVQSAQEMKRGYKLTLDRDAAEYMLEPIGALRNWTDVWSDKTYYGGEEAKRARKFMRQAEGMLKKVQKGLGIERKLGKDLVPGDVVLVSGFGFQPITRVAPDGKYDVRLSFGAAPDKLERTHAYVNVLPSERQENPTPDEMLAEHAETWQEVEWLGGEDYDGDGTYAFYMTLPCPESPEGEDESVTEKRVEANVRHLFARTALESMDQLALPEIRKRPRTPPAADIEVEYTEGDDEAYLSLSFPPDLSGPRVRDMVWMLDALDKNVETLCAKKKRRGARAANPAPTTNAGLVGRLKF